MDVRRWRIGRGTQLHWRRLDDEWVAFDAGSGDTHYLDGISAAVLVCLEVEGHSLDGLTQVLTRELGLPAEALQGRLATLLAQLSQLGLIEAAEA